MKRYISEIIDFDFMDWGGKKIVINAPTGAGKTTFILEKIIPFIQKTKGKRIRPDKKVLILCNRRLLRKQYFYDSAMKFEYYKDMEDVLEIATYQELAYKLQKGENPESWFKDFAIICLDEVHYFYADSDFNGMGTYPLLQAIMIAGLGKEMIFMSATMDCVLQFIEKTASLCFNFMREKYDERGIYLSSIFNAECREFLSPVSHLEQSYDYLRCICVQDRKTLCQKIMASDGKSVVFIDDKKWAESFTDELKANGMYAREICQLNADNLEDSDNNSVVKNLVMANKLLPKVLITTSVLDNGVSIKDPDVKNLVIMTESKISFLQMLGRVRREYVKEKLNLLFMLRPAEYFEQRENQCRKFLEVYEEIQQKSLKNCFIEIFSKLLNEKDDEIKSIYQKLIIALPDYLMVDKRSETQRISCRMGDIYFMVNPLAVQKVGDLYLLESKFHKLARENPINVVLEQLHWIGLGKNDLYIEKSTYLEQREEEFVKKLLSMKDFTNEEYGRFKEELNSEFRKDFFSGIVEKNGSFSKEKFLRILEQYGFELIEDVGLDQKKRYSIQRKC